MKITVCATEQLPVGASRVVVAGEREILVANIDGNLVAVDNVCAHKQQPLGGGVIKAGIITCPSHLWRYDLRTGERIDSPGWSVACHEVSISGSSIVVEVPDPPPLRSIRDQLLEHAKEWRRDP